MNHSLECLYAIHFGTNPIKADILKGSAGSRLYYRLTAADGSSVIGVVGDNYKENHAFLKLADSFRKASIRVPEVLAVSEDEMCYLLEDLGNETLFDRLSRCHKNNDWDSDTLDILCKVVAALPRIQYEGAKHFNFAECSREPRFSESTVRWDLNYFKYCFLKPSGLVFDEMELEKDFDRLVSTLLDPVNEVAEGHFLYRDFQSRNIMIKDGEPYFIDFQGGSEGPVYYDVASFFWQARANWPYVLRETQLRSYLGHLLQYTTIKWDVFEKRLAPFVLFRLVQVLGAYGFRGLFERKSAFISPIGSALQLVNESIAQYHLTNKYPYLCKLLAELNGIERFHPQASDGKLTVRITSFSYKNGIPDDYSGNGGGFVFDCRAPHNPGRYAEYKKITGLQQPVIDFLEHNTDAMSQYLGEERYRQIEADKLGTELTMPQYLENVYGVVVPAVATYLARNFTSLCVNFGCTGGQHRSVYGAQHLAEHLKSLYPDLRIVLTHRELGITQEL